MFRKIVGKYCGNAPDKCESAKRGDVLDPALNLCEECGRELAVRTVIDTRKLAMAVAVIAVLLGVAGYGGFVTVRAMMIRKATEAVVTELSASYDESTVAAFRLRVENLIKGQGYDPRGIAAVRDALRSEIAKSASAPEFESRIRALLAQPESPAALDQELTAAAADWSRTTGLSPVLLKARAREIVSEAQRAAAQFGKTVRTAAGAADPATGIADLEQAVRREPANSWAHANLCAAYLRADRVPEAAVSCQQALRLGSDNWLAHYNMGCVLARRGDQAAAMNELALALSHVPDARGSPMTKADLVSQMKADEMLQSMRGSARFRDLTSPK